MKTSQGQIQELSSDSKSNAQLSKPLRSEKGSESTKAPIYGVTSYRWVILVIYALCNLAGGFIMLPFGSCSPAVAEVGSLHYQIYGTSEDVVGLTAEIFLILYIPMNYPVVWVLDNWGVRFSVVTGIVLTVIGCWVRLIVVLQHSFSWIIAGQILGGIASPFLLNASAKLASTWFLPNERPLATSIGAVFLQVGNAVVFVAPIYYFKEKEYYVGRHQIGRQNMASYLWMWAIAGSAILLLTLVFFRKKPKIPPSASSELKRDPVCRSLIQLLKNCNFMVMLVGYTLIYGIYTIIGACISFFTDHYGFSTFDTGYLAATFIMFGLLGSIFYSYIVLKTSKYKFVFLFCSLLLNIGLALCTLCLINGSDYLVWAYLAFGFSGFNLIPLIPLSYDFGSELGYPVSEAVVCGTLGIVAQVWGTGAYFIVIAIKNASVPMGLWSMVISTVVGLIILFFVKEKLIRKNADEKAGLLEAGTDYDEIHETS